MRLENYKIFFITCPMASSWNEGNLLFNRGMKLLSKKNLQLKKKDVPIGRKNKFVNNRN